MRESHRRKGRPECGVVAKGETIQDMNIEDRSTRNVEDILFVRF